MSWDWLRTDGRATPTGRRQGGRADYEYIGHGCPTFASITLTRTYDRPINVWTLSQEGRARDCRRLAQRLPSVPLGNRFAFIYDISLWHDAGCVFAMAANRQCEVPVHAIRTPPVLKYFSLGNREFTVIHASEWEFLPPIPNADPSYNLQGRELRAAIWLVDRCPEVAYMLKRYSSESDFLGSLQIDPKHIAIVRRENGWTLDPTVVKAWMRLENALLYVCNKLLSAVAHPSEYCFPLDPFWPTPTECGYNRLWGDERGARRAAYRSLDACRVLLARCSMAIALASPDPGAPLPRWVEILLREGADPKWVDVFRASLISSLKPGVRVGMYLNPSLNDAGTKWVDHIPCMVRANVPVYIYWPREGREKILERYPCLRPYIPVAAETVTLPSSYEDVTCFRWRDVSSVPGTASVSPPETPHGQGQLPGETAEAFFRRRHAANLVREANETEWSRERRMARKTKALGFERPTGKDRATVYLWRTVGDVDGTVPQDWLEKDYRELIGHSRVGQIWGLYANEHKKYDSFKHEWDICVKLAPSIRPLEADEGTEDDDDLLEMSTSPHAPSYIVHRGDTHADTVAKSFATDLLQFYESHSVSYIPPVESLPTVVRKRFGVTAGVVPDHSNPEPQYSALHIQKLLGYYDADLACEKNLVHALSTWVASLERQQHHATANGVVWDLCSDSAEYLLYHPHPCMQVAMVTLNNGSWYRIRYDVPSDDNTWWELILKNATNVLELYRRHDIQTRFAAARFMAERGMHFHSIFTPAPRDYIDKMYWTDVTFAVRPPGYVFTYDDYRMFEHRVRCHLTRAKARGAMLQGGIVWRIVLEIVPEDLVTSAAEGPCDNVFRFGDRFRGPRGDDYFDDMVSRDELDLICGVYKVYQGMYYDALGKRHTNKGSADYSTTADVSWWPRWNQWKGSGMDFNRWTPAAEKWFLSRLDKIRAGTAEMHNAKEWRAALRRRPDPGKLEGLVEVASVKFLEGEMRLRQIEDVSDRKLPTDNGVYAVKKVWV
ncbi:hypothetical protein L227DRAFT_563977 [Lentinus tigrinus ALCF2SS1-6]|uniref:Uncharacterized protein n=1 Tax=Lentinus tigrinus ALCF2SS1-6 TaxID=1328759 RepID=A0A5C2S6U3_9APHY|nr:hypothetical protein L227DRAFT_563977 [Lentinus tigrinus ALCF2SS1-6]